MFYSDKAKFASIQLVRKSGFGSCLIWALMGGLLMGLALEFSLKMEIILIKYFRFLVILI